MNRIAELLRERSTWAGIIGLVASMTGFVISPDLATDIITLGTAAGSLWYTLTRD